MADWKDVTVVLCVLLVVIGVAALGAAAHTFTIVRGGVLEKGVAALDIGDRSLPTKTISVLIENDDRVFMVERGTVVKYAVSDQDAQLIDVGFEVKLPVSSYQSTAKVIGSSLATESSNL